MALSLPTPRRLGYRVSWTGILAASVVLFWAVIAVIGPALMPHDPGEIVDFDYFGPMSEALWFGWTTWGGTCCRAS